MSDSFNEVIETQKLSPLLASIFWNRGLRTNEAIQAFLNPNIDQLHDPYLLFDMQKAVERIRQAIASGEKILVYGDYDADGITSTTVMYETLETLGADVTYYLPNRFRDGYGPNKKVYEEKIATGIQLIITVDNGVSGHEAITFANQQEVDVIVTDHHELPSELPQAYAIIHPRHPKGNYPFGDLAGVGVAFKVACALMEETAVDYLDLVAIGTVADMVSLTDENRALVALGLKLIKNTERVGLAELIKISGLKEKEVDETSIGFGIAPRLNALGRLEDANPAVLLLTTFDEEEARLLAEKMENVNNERKDLVEKITTEAMARIDPEDKIHLVVGNNWHEGVLGIVAGKIVQKTGRPTLVLTIKDNGIAKGSGRSVDSVDLYKVLNEARELFTSFGGHHAAVGLSLEIDHIESLRTRLNQYMIANQIETKNELIVDKSMPIEAVSLSMIADLQKLAPFGVNNALPTFLFEEIEIRNCRSIGTENQHLKFTLADKSGHVLEGIGFGFGADLMEFQGPSVSLVGQLSINEWNGNRMPQLQLKDYQVTGLQVFDLRSKTNQSKVKLSKKIVIISFSKQNIKKWQQIIHHPVVLCDESQPFKDQTEAKNYCEILFLDCPIEKDRIKEITRQTKTSRVYLMCRSVDEAYLDGMGTKEQFAKLFKFIKVQGRIDVRYKANMVADYLKIPKNLLIFMIQVFFELGFVTIEDGILTSVKNPENHPLSESDSYQKRKRKIQSEEFLVLSDLPTIKDWLRA